MLRVRSLGSYRWRIATDGSVREIVNGLQLVAGRWSRRMSKNDIVAWRRIKRPENWQLLGCPEIFSDNGLGIMTRISGCWSGAR